MASVKMIEGKSYKSIKGGISELILEAVKNSETTCKLLDFFYGLIIEDCRLYVDTIEFNKIEFVQFRTVFKEDKRKSNKQGNYIKEIKIELTKDIPLDFYIMNLAQKLTYDTAKENKERLEREITELEKEIQVRKAEKEELEKIMKTERYE